MFASSNIGWKMRIYIFPITKLNVRIRVVKGIKLVSNAQEGNGSLEGQLPLIDSLGVVIRWELCS